MPVDETPVALIADLIRQACPDVDLDADEDDEKDAEEPAEVPAGNPVAFGAFFRRPGADRINPSSNHQRRLIKRDHRRRPMRRRIRPQPRRYNRHRPRPQRTHLRRDNRFLMLLVAIFGCGLMFRSHVDWSSLTNTVRNTLVSTFSNMMFKAPSTSHHWIRPSVDCCLEGIKHPYFGSAAGGITVQLLLALLTGMWNSFFPEPEPWNPQPVDPGRPANMSRAQY